MFRLTSEPIGPKGEHPSRAGATLVFTGIVRAENEGREVGSLEYEAMAPVAEKEGQAICEEAKSRFDVLEVDCVHRTGKLAIGEAAVVIEVVSPHRAAAFDACRYVIEQLKLRVPIWKKEGYLDGGTEWVGAPGTPEDGLSVAETGRYAQVASANDWSGGDQQRLKAESVLIAGLNGVGTAVAVRLAASGIGRITLFGQEEATPGALPFHPWLQSADVGRSIAHVMAEKVRSVNPHVDAVPLADELDDEPLSALVAEHSVVVDCTLCHETSMTIARAAQASEASVMHFRIDSTAATTLFVRPGQPGACFACQWPSRQLADCREAELPRPSLQAAIGASIAWEVERSSGKTNSSKTDLQTGARAVGLIEDRPDCPLCKGGTANAGPIAVLVSAAEELAGWSLFDVREPDEQEEDPITGFDCVSAPKSKFDFRALANVERPLLVCARGVRALILADDLRRDGLANVWSLTGGRETLRHLERRGN